jgi:hypothetical protein
MVQSRPPEQALSDWAARHRYRIISKEVPNFSQAPWPWTNFSSTRLIYYITVQTPSGNIRKGWVRCTGLYAPIARWGDWQSLGSMLDVEVRWDDEVDNPGHS